MAVAVKSTMETASQRPLNRLAVNSWIGAVYILGSLALIFFGVPHLWDLVGANLPFTGTVHGAIKLLLMVAAAGALLFVGNRMVGQEPPAGLTGGIVFGTVELVVLGLLVRWIGSLLEGSFENAAIGIGLTVGVGAVLILAAVVFSFRPRFERLAIQVEEQGWFTRAAYKRSQGQRVRRGTILGVLLLAGAGIWTLLHRDLLPAANWTVRIPFADIPLTVLPAPKYVLPLLLMGVSLWFAYRIVNLPVFADFLIATEAELNKVSWTTRRRLFQDTVVVLVTVVLLTVFLFVVDQIWGFVLTKVGVLQISPSSGGTLGAREIPW
jgi:preprotein translocase SecE subunit